MIDEHKDAHLKGVKQDQSEVIAFLSNPKSYSSSLSKVECIETHGAMIFLAGEDVYKIKKAVQFSYLDFSTLERRRKICEREVKINRRTAPDIYLGVIPICRNVSGKLTIGGKDNPVEWAVHMRRFDQGNVLINIAKSGQLTEKLVKKLAYAIAGYHDQARTFRDANGIDQISSIIGELETAFTSVPDILGADAIQTFSQKIKQQFEEAEHCLRLRANRGYVRRCHGDLHLANIVLIEGEPILFDAIEFDEDLATIDIFYDIAFLIMDLMQCGLKHPANLLLNRYLYHSYATANLYGLKALPLFLACRAGVRSMVAINRIEQLSGNAKADHIERAKTYFHSALNYLDLSPPRLIAIGGFSGTGKSTLSAALAPSIGNAPGALHLRSDLERKAMFEVDETEHLDPQLYTPMINARVYDFLFQKAVIALKTGHSVIVDAVHAQDSERKGIEEIAQNLGIPFTGLWLTTSRDKMMSRVTERRGDASDATPDIVEKQLKQSTGPISWHSVDTSRSIAETLVEIENIIKTPPTSL